MIHVRARLLAGALPVAAFLLAVALPSAASAAQAHAFKEDFGSAGTGAGRLELASPDFSVSPEVAGSGVAVNAESGDVYVADTGNHRVDEFSSTGAFIRAWGWGVEDGAAKAETCTTTPGCQGGIPGTGPGQFKSPTFIAVDNSPGGEGDVYVADSAAAGAGDSFVQKFSADGTLLTAWGADGKISGGPITGTGHGEITAGSSTVTGVTVSNGALIGGKELSGEDIPPETFITVANGDTLTLTSSATATKAGVELQARTAFIQIGGIAVNAAGDLWVGYAFGYLQFGRSGSFLQGPVGQNGLKPVGIGVNAAGDLYEVLGARGVIKRDPSGNKIGVVEESQAPVGLTVDLAHGDLYTDTGTEVDNFPADCDPTLTGAGEPAGLCSPSQTFGAGQLHGGAGLAVDTGAGPTAGNIYVASTATDEIAVFDTMLEATIGTASAVTATTATLSGRVNPEGSELSRCRFEYGSGEGFSAAAPCETEHGEPIGDGAAPVAVHAGVAGLAGGATYHFRLRATSATADVRSEHAEFPTLSLPGIEEAKATAVTAGSATLSATIDPHGLDTNYRFEYGACATPSTCSTSLYTGTAPEAPVDIGSGSSGVSVSQPIVGLSPGVTYHFRVAAASVNGTETSPEHTFVFLAGPTSGACPNEALRTGLSALLPDCRAYEMVTPPETNGATISASAVFNLQEVGISANGDRVSLPVIQCFAGARSCTANRFIQGTPYVFERSSGGWAANSLTPAANQFSGISRFGISADADTALLVGPSSPGGVEAFYLGGPGGALTQIGPITDEAETATEITEVHTMTPDLSHLVYETATRPLWSFDPGYRIGEGPGGSGASGLYEYADGPRPLLVGVSGGFESTDLISRCGTVDPNRSSRGFLSADGDTVYFAAAKCSTGTGANTGLAVPARELYVRIDGEGPGAETIAVSESQCGSGGGGAEVACRAAAPADSNFQGAAQDGSIAYFTSTQQLTDEASDDSDSHDSAKENGCSEIGGANGCNLYLFDSSRPEGHRLTAVSAGDTSGLGPQVQGAVAISADGSHVYFVARGVLSGADAEGKEPREGGENLYVYERDAAHPAGRTSFIATLVGTAAGGKGDTAQWRPGPLAANVSPDGNFLVFTSHAGLTPDAISAVGPAQVYRYDAEAEALKRISIGRQGFADNGNAGSGDARVAEPSAQVIVAPGRADPTMSDDASRIFFQSPNGVTPGAVNDVPINSGGALAQNVYEWEADGTELDGRVVCEEPSGCVSLISDGRDLAAEGSHLLGSDPSGADVLFTSSDQILPADTDSGYDVYDAHENGGFAESPEPTPCQDDACKGSGTHETAPGSPASGTFAGPEEGPKSARTSKCKKGLVKKGGKCLKKSKPKKHHEKGSNKPHAKGKKKGHKKNQRAAKSDRRAEK
jgi:NHL repeat